MLPQASAGAVWVGGSECPAWSSVGQLQAACGRSGSGSGKPLVEEMPILKAGGPGQARG